MYARLNVMETPSDRIEEGARVLREQVLPAVQRIDGFKGLIGLVDRESGKTLGITLWEDQTKMLASEEEASRIRSEAAEAMGAKPVVERYEVSIWEV